MPRTPLTRAAVLRAAMELADADGLPALSMRAVARALGVEAMSLYHHVANKDAMLDGMVDEVFAAFHLPEIGAPWRAELRTRSVSARAVLHRHPWAVGLMDSRRNAGYETVRHHDAVLGCLRESGFSWELAGSAFALLDAHLYGFLVQELALPFEGEADLAELAGAMFDALPAGELPYFRGFATERALQPGYSFAPEFEIGLDLILDGLERRHLAQ
ncbi:TetR family transcriptional regulator [Nocardioides marmoriginsengisoli]|uniref:TetR family transcriptional regulator n=1 Tax=Nocardioides marmoriginsengisoli TaxID=661483 RepID=A0A3N0CFG9_9ACTN|nr:TetR/AcrR family transcriptional regulator C-terminal domain-containing protein [Nocardioides marmoriginsengisoli]RNL61981.1 TetR family transcriptional regulator [Nocardioides marmoriginsengisoli]